MNRNGFTLIELLAVLVILFSVSMVSVGGISASLERREKKECEEQKELAVGAAKIYFSLNNVSSVTISQLKSANYFGENKKVDRLRDSDTIRLSAGLDGYDYIGTSCPE